MWINDDIEKWALYQCWDGNDCKDMWDIIENPNLINLYCIYVKDRKCMRNKLKTDFDIFYYCKTIKDHEDLWRRIKSDKWKYNYCKYVKFRPELFKEINSLFLKFLLYTYNLNYSIFHSLKLIIKEFLKRKNNENYI